VLKDVLSFSLCGVREGQSDTSAFGSHFIDASGSVIRQRANSTITAKLQAAGVSSDKASRDSIVRSA